MGIYLSTGRLMTEGQDSCVSDRTWRAVLAPPDREINRMVLSSAKAFAQLGEELYDIEHEPHHTFSKAVAWIGRLVATIVRCFVDVASGWGDLLFTHYISQSYCGLRLLWRQSAATFKSLTDSVLTW